MMKISNKKRKYILRNARLKSPEDLAKELRVPLKHINSVLNPYRETDEGGETGLLPSLSFWIIAIVLFVAPLAVFNGLYDYSRLPKSALIQVGAALLLFTWLLACRKRPIPIHFSTYRFFLPLPLFLLWSLISFSWATNLYDSFTLLVHWTACGVFCLVAFHVLSTQQRIISLFYLLCAAASLVSAIGLLQHFSGIDWIIQRAAPAATFGNKNMAAQFVGLCMPAAIAVFILARGRAAVGFSAASLSLTATYLFHTHTKAVWLAAFGQVLVFFTLAVSNRVLEKPAFRSRKAAAGITAAAAVLVLTNLTGSGWSWEVGTALQKFQPVFSAVMGKRPHEVQGGDDDPLRTASVAAKGADGSSDGMQGHGIDPQPPEKDLERDSAGARLMIWRNSLQLIKMHPFTGVGLNNFGAQYAQTAIGRKKDSLLELHYGPRHAHNDLLQIAAELGLPAVIFLAGFGLAIFIRAGKIFRSATPDADKIIAIACLAAMAELALNACASFPLYRALPPLIAAMYLAVFYRLSVNSAEEAAAESASNEERRPLRRLAAALAAGSLVLLAAWTVVQARWIAADRFSKLRAAAMSARDWRATLYWGGKAADLNPLRPDVKHALGRAHYELKNYPAAVPYLIDDRRMYPHDTHNLFFLGKTYEMLGDYADAEKQILHLLRILPRHAASHDVLGRIYAKQNRHEEAMREFRIATQLAPDSSDFFINRGAEAYKGLLYEDAVRFFEKAVELDPQSATARKNLGITLWRHLGRATEGVRHMRKALALNPEIEGHQAMRRIVTEHESPSR